jgi:hypothetical protein
MGLSNVAPHTVTVPSGQLKCPAHMRAHCFSCRQCREQNALAQPYIPEIAYAGPASNSLQYVCKAGKYSNSSIGYCVEAGPARTQVQYQVQILKTAHIRFMTSMHTHTITYFNLSGSSLQSLQACAPCNRAKLGYMQGHRHRAWLHHAPCPQKLCTPKHTQQLTGRAKSICIK